MYTNYLLYICIYIYMYVCTYIYLSSCHLIHIYWETGNTTRTQANKKPKGIENLEIHHTSWSSCLGLRCAFCGMRAGRWLRVLAGMCSFLLLATRLNFGFQAFTPIWISTKFALWTNCLIETMQWAFYLRFHCMGTLKPWSMVMGRSEPLWPWLAFNCQFVSCGFLKKDPDK